MTELRFRAAKCGIETPRCEKQRKGAVGVNNKSQIVKHVILVALTVLTALFQNSFLPALGARHVAWCLLALLTAIAMRQTELFAAAYGLLAGLLWDIASPLPDGVITLFLTVYACACSLLARYLFRRTLLTAAVFCGGGCTIWFALSLLLNCAAKDFGALPGIILRCYLPPFLLTALALPVYEFAVRAVETRFGAKPAKLT